MPRTRQRVLATLLLNPEREWYLTEIASAVGMQPANLQREMKSLADGGIVSQRRDGNRVYYRVEEDAPYYQPLRESFSRTVGVVSVMRQRLVPVLKPRDIAFVFGSFARGEEGAVSDVDLLVIKDTSLFGLSLPIRGLEEGVLRSVNAVTYSVPEFRPKWRSKNHFIVTVVGSPNLFLKGCENDLAELTR